MRYQFQANGHLYEISIETQGQGFSANLQGVSYTVELLDERPGKLSLLFNGNPKEIYWAVDETGTWIALEGCTYLLEKPSNKSYAHLVGQQSSESLRAPMPAQVRLLEVKAGDRVEKGQTLMILEAMKMEIRIQAPISGRMVRLLVSEGQGVKRNQILAELRQEEI